MYSTLFGSVCGSNRSKGPAKKINWFFTVFKLLDVIIRGILILQNIKEKR
jgi:hypothetical protein